MDKPEQILTVSGKNNNAWSKNSMQIQNNKNEYNSIVLLVLRHEDIYKTCNISKQENED
jgi:hypothetical protein